MTLAATDALDFAIRSWGAEFSWPAEQVLRLLLAAACGGLVGIEREVRGRHAGFRTNLLVSVGSALVMLVSINFAERGWARLENANLNIDPARIAYGIMTGIGFLGAGAILKHGASIRGLTTAAALWCVAAVGMASGFGMYTLTIIATIIIVAALWILDYVENFIPRIRYRTLVIRRRWGADCVVETINKLKKAGMKVYSASFQRTPDLQHVDISVQAAFKNWQTYYALERALEIDDRFELIATKEE
jgi:putative Mg2+ transporter-C (MgtC) family protein